MSPDKGAHRAVTIALEAGLPLKIAGKCAEPAEQQYFDAHVRPHLGGDREYVGEVSARREGRAAPARARDGLPDLLAGAVRARDDRVDGLRDAGDRDPLGRRAGGDRPRPHRDHRRRLARDGGRARGRRRARPGRDAARGRGALHAGADGRRLRRRVRGRDLRAECGFAPSTTARSSGSRSRRSARSPPSRSTSSSTRRSSAISAGRSSRRSAIAATVLSGALRDLQLPPVRHDRAGGARLRRRRGARSRTGSARRRSGSRSASASPSPSSSSRSRRRSSRLMGGEGETADYAVTYLRIAALGLPFAFLALGGQGYLRGVADLRTPLVIVIAANVVERRARGALRLRLRLGDRGLGVGDGDRAGRDGRGLRRRHPPRRPRRRAAGRCELMRRLLVIGRYIFVRTAALLRRLHARRRRDRALRRRLARGAPDRVPALDLPRASSSTRSRSPAR